MKQKLDLFLIKFLIIAHRISHFDTAHSYYNLIMKKICKLKNSPQFLHHIFCRVLSHKETLQKIISRVLDINQEMLYFGALNVNASK